jgi:hypothetical protein
MHIALDGGIGMCELLAICRSASHIFVNPYALIWIGSHISWGSLPS